METKALGRRQAMHQQSLASSIPAGVDFSKEIQIKKQINIYIGYLQDI